ncbi:MAG: sulfotransferase family protein, partial [Anaerolineales bacterium]
LLHGEAVERLAAVYPDARLIYILRDGRDALVSQRLQSFVDAVHTLSREDRRVRREFLESPDGFLGRRSIFLEADLRRRAERWARNVTETVALGTKLFTDRFHFLRFEDLLADPAETLKTVWVFLDAAPPGVAEERALRLEMERNPDAEWQRRQLGDVAARIPKGGTGSWKAMMTPGDLAVVEQAAGATLREWGYPQGGEQ